MYTYLHAHTVELSISCFLILENKPSRYQKRKRLCKHQGNDGFEDTSTVLIGLCKIKIEF